MALPDLIENSELVPTLNKMGFMTLHLDPFSREFIAYSKKSTLPVMEVGAAYGTVVHEVLKNGTRIIANDLSEDHLKILEQNAPTDKKHLLTLNSGDFLKNSNVIKGSLSAIFTSRVIHFFSAEGIDIFMKKCFDLLAPGGKLIIVSETPYLKDYKEFIPIFEERKKTADLWPGLVEDVSIYAPVRGNNIPNLLHFFDHETLKDVLERYGFHVEKSALIKREDYPDDLTLDGRESVGAVARKPLK